MAARRDELLSGAAEFGSDFIPVYGDIKSIAEAQSALDYLISMAGIFPPAKVASKLFHGIEVALKKGDIAEASRLLNKANEDIAVALPKPGGTSIPSNGIGANSIFKINDSQLGKKLGKHVEDFGGNASNASDRKMVLDKINNIGKNPDKITQGTFAGQGVNGARGDFFFRIKGNDVVVTKPDGSFVTILKDGVTSNSSVKNALKGNP